jgi:hypothetical protein
MKKVKKSNLFQLPNLPKIKKTMRRMTICHPLKKSPAKLAPLRKTGVSARALMMKVAAKSLIILT